MNKTSAAVFKLSFCSNVIVYWNCTHLCCYCMEYGTSLQEVLRTLCTYPGVHLNEQGQYNQDLWLTWEVFFQLSQKTQTFWPIFSKAQNNVSPPSFQEKVWLHRLEFFLLCFESWLPAKKWILWRAGIDSWRLYIF